MNAPRPAESARPLTLREVGTDAALWVGIGLLNLAALLPFFASIDREVTGFTVYVNALGFFACIATAPVVRRLAPQWVASPTSVWTALTVAGMAIAFHVLNVLSDYALVRLGVVLFPEQAPADLFALDVATFSRGLTFSLLIYAALAGALVSVAYRDRLVRQQREAAELQAELARAQVSTLRMQLNPHFLFNTLNGIAGMIPERPSDAQEAVAELSELLRGVLRTPAEGATLADEVAWLGRYLDLQALRFEDRLGVEVDVPEDLLESRVPGFLLQPIVENAFEHGVARITRPGQVTVRARREGSRLVLDVLDNGPGLAGGDGLADGLGVATTRERLARAYGDGASLRLTDRTDGPGTHVRLTLPLTTDVPRA